MPTIEDKLRGYVKELGVSLESVDVSSQFLLWLQDGMSDLYDTAEGQLSFVQSSQTVTTEPGVEQYVLLPSAAEVTSIYLVRPGRETVHRKLSYTVPTDPKLRYLDDRTDIVYYSSGEYLDGRLTFIVYPTPRDVFELRVHFAADPAALSLDTEELNIPGPLQVAIGHYVRYRYWMSVGDQVRAGAERSAWDRALVSARRRWMAGRDYTPSMRDRDDFRGHASSRYRNGAQLPGYYPDR